MTEFNDLSEPPTPNNFQKFCGIPDLHNTSYSEISTNFFVKGLKLSDEPISNHPLKLYLLTFDNEDPLPDIRITRDQVCEQLFSKVFNKTFCKEKTEEQIVAIIQNPLPIGNNLHIDLCHTILSMLPDSLQEEGKIMYDKGENITDIISQLVKKVEIIIDFNLDKSKDQTNLRPIDIFYSKLFKQALNYFSITKRDCDEG